MVWSDEMSKVLILDGISGVPLAKELCEAFTNIGTTVTYADLRKFESLMFYGLKSAFRKALNKRENADSFYHLPKLNEASFEAYIRQESPSVILVIGFVYKYLTPAFLLKIKQQYNVKLFLYDTDSCNLYSKRREFIFFIEDELPIYDEIFSFSKITTRFFKDTRKLNASFLPFGAKKLELPINVKQSIDVLFIGSCDLRRVFIFENIRSHVTVFGDRWSRNYPLMSDELKSRVTDHSVWGEKLYQLLFASKIVLNITRSHFYGAETGINLRIFEALAAGCFLLTDYCEELTEIFVVGEEIEVFRSSVELVEKVEYYLANPEKRLEIARRGHQKFLTLHTWDAKASFLMEKFLG
jgi:spore maturation protein CgeB